MGQKSEKSGGNAVVSKLLILVLIFAVLGGGVFMFLGFRPDGGDGLSENLATFSVQRGDLTISVTESGNIKALNSKDIKSEVEGRTTIISIVDEGTYIRLEDVNNLVLIELDSSKIKEKLTQQEITYLKAQASYTEAKESLDIQKKQNDSDIQAGKMKVRFTMMDLQKYLGRGIADLLVSNGTTGLDGQNKIAKLIDDPNLGGKALQALRELKDKIALAEMRFARAVDKLEGTRKLYENKYVAEIELKGDELEKESLEIQKEAARTDLQLFELYEFQKEAEKLLSDYYEAERELERVEARARSQLAQAEAKLSSADATYSLQKERLEKLQKQLAACVIRAPAVGQVTYYQGRNRWSRQLIAVGEDVRERQTIISIPDPCQMKVEIKIHETWIDKIEPNLPAKITVAAFPEKKFTGHVIKKAPLADPEHWMNPDLKVYATDVTIDGRHDYLKTGMTGKVEIIIKELKDVLKIPIQAVINKDGKKICYVLNSKRMVQREVETGEFNDDFVEIKSGLVEGEKVVLAPPRATESEGQE